MWHIVNFKDTTNCFKVQMLRLKRARPYVSSAVFFCNYFTTGQIIAFYTCAQALLFYVYLQAPATVKRTNSRSSTSRDTNTWRLFANSVVRDNPSSFFFSTQRISVPGKKKTTTDHQPAGSSQSFITEKSDRKEECERNVRNKKREREKKTGSGEKNIKCSAGGREKRNPVHTHMLLYSHSWRLSAPAHHCAFPPAQIVRPDFFFPSFFLSLVFLLLLLPLFPVQPQCLTGWLAHNQKWQKNIPVCNRSPGQSEGNLEAMLYINTTKRL